MGIILNILATLGVISQFFIEHRIKKNQLKRWVGFTIMILAAIGIWGSFFVQNRDNQKLSNSLESIITTNNELRVILKEREKDITTVRDQNDSLKIMLADFKKRQEEFIIISEISTKEISRSREILQNISNSSFTRGITEIDKIKMVSILRQHKGKELVITTIMGDSEALQFASTLKEVFIAAGWNVDGINQAIYTDPVKGLKIRVQSENYPPRVNQIVQALNLLELKVEGWLGEDFAPDDLELIVGAK
jgi:hypothetical protein